MIDLSTCVSAAIHYFGMLRAAERFACYQTWSLWLHVTVFPDENTSCLSYIPVSCLPV